jgi:hypothetical protein
MVNNVKAELEAVGREALTHILQVHNARKSIIPTQMNSCVAGILYKIYTT